jgi:hypothetical protein
VRVGRLERLDVSRLGQLGEQPRPEGRHLIKDLVLGHSVQGGQQGGGRNQQDRREEREEEEPHAPLLLERVLELGALDLNRPLALMLKDALVGPARSSRKVIGPAKGVGTGAEGAAVGRAVARPEG